MIREKNWETAGTLQKCNRKVQGGRQQSSRSQGIGSVGVPHTPIVTRTRQYFPWHPRRPPPRPPRAPLAAPASAPGPSAAARRGPRGLPTAPERWRRLGPAQLLGRRSTGPRPGSRAPRPRAGRRSYLVLPHQSQRSFRSRTLSRAPARSFPVQDLRASSPALGPRPG